MASPKTVTLVLCIVLIAVVSAQPRSNLKWFSWHSDGKNGYDIFSNFKDPAFGKLVDSHEFHDDRFFPPEPRRDVPWNAMFDKDPRDPGPFSRPFWGDRYHRPDFDGYPYEERWNRPENPKMYPPGIKPVHFVVSSKHGPSSTEGLKRQQPLKPQAVSQSKSKESKDQVHLKLEAAEPKKTISGTAISYTVSKTSSTENGQTKTDEFGTVSKQDFDDKTNPDTGVDEFLSVLGKSEQNFSPFTYPKFGFLDDNFFGTRGGLFDGFML